jgi:DNA modification methylase
MPKTTIIEGSCISAMSHLDRDSLPDLVFLDPPPYDIPDDDPSKVLRVNEEQYKYNIRAATMLSWKVCQGVMVLHGDDELVKLWLDLEDKAGMSRVCWINWLYDFGKNDRHNFNDSRTHLLVYAKDTENYTKNIDSVLISGAKKGSKATRTPGRVWGIPPDGPNWGRVTGTSKEHVASGRAQLPENLMARIIKFYSNPGDTVLDPYSNAGTTAVVAEALGRSVIAIDDDTTVTEERIQRGPSRKLSS